MNKSSQILVPDNHDGTSQRGRGLAALRPDFVAIDERKTGDLLEFVRSFVERLRYFEVDEATQEVLEAGRWTNFAHRSDISVADMVAYIADPSRVDADKASWLGRPHFALLLTFLELLAHAREQLNGLTRRHLDYYYLQVLRMLPEPAIADQVAVVFRLAPRVAQVRLPAGTALQAGRDARGIARIYQTERDVFVSRAQVASLRSVFVRRDIIGLGDVWRELPSGPDAAEDAFEEMLAIGLGSPRPGDPVPAFHGAPTDIAFIVACGPTIDFAEDQLFLAHHELRALMRLADRLSATPTEDLEWPGIVQLIEELGKHHHVGDPDWVIGTPTTFDGALALAFDGIDWIAGLDSIHAYHAHIRDLERHFSMPIEHLAQLVVAASDLQLPEWSQIDWSQIQRILARAHAERARAARQAILHDTLAGRTNILGFEALVSYVLGESIEVGGVQVAGDSFDWEAAQLRVAGYLEAAQVSVLLLFRDELLTNEGPSTYEWADLYRLLEQVQRGVEGVPESEPELIEWHNLYAYEDAPAVVDVTEAARWKTFGRAPASEDVTQPQAALGWALRSPALALSEGTRTLTLTLAFEPASCNFAALEAEFAITSGDSSYEALETALRNELVIEVTTAKGWLEITNITATLLEYPLDGDPPVPALELVLAIDSTTAALEPLAGSGDRWPTLRILLRRGPDGATNYSPFEPLLLAFVHVEVDVVGLAALQIQHEDRALDPRKPFEPFGTRPISGARFYLSHPELVRARLDTLTLALEWMGVPADLPAHYSNYPDFDVDELLAEITLIEDKHAQVVLADQPLFVEEVLVEAEEGVEEVTTWANLALVCDALPQSAGYRRRLDVEATDDVRLASRHLRVELTGADFGHSTYPPLAAQLATQLAMQLATQNIAPEAILTEAPKYHVNPPYTPTIKQLSVSYSTSIHLDLATAGVGVEDELLHIHPFGTAPIGVDEKRFLPRYDNAGELYIGLRDVVPAQNLSLLVQLAEGTSNPEILPSPVKWSRLDGDRWADCDVVFDSTRGLLNSGIVELQLPTVAPSTRLPAGLYWLRVAIGRSTDSVCDTVAIRAQAVTVRLQDRGNAPEHYEQPLAVGSITRLLAPDARIAGVEQPFTSFGGKPPERDELVHTRVSERLRHKQRALTAWDYERLVLHRFSQIYKAKCLPAGASAGPGCVDVIVIPDIRNALPGDPFAPKAPTNLLADIQAYLAERAPATATVRVRNARYVPVLLRVAVRFQAGQDEGYAKKQLNEDLNRFLSPWAYDQGADLEIAGKIYANSLIDFVDRLDYVDYVANLGLFTVEGNIVKPGKVGTGDYHVAASRPDTVLVAARQHHIEVIPEFGYQIESFTGIGYMKVELDFIVV